MAKVSFVCENYFRINNLSTCYFFPLEREKREEDKGTILINPSIFNATKWTNLFIFS